jgi:site-specific recombinase
MYSARLGASIGRGAAGFGSNVSLGVALAVVPMAGKFTGLPISVAHVTLSTAAYVFALRALAAQPELNDLAVRSGVGIALIGLLNFGVAFACAFAVALRAKRVKGSWTRKLLWAVVLRFLRAPWEFLLPPRTVKASAGSGSDPSSRHG